MEFQTSNRIAVSSVASVAFPFVIVFGLVYAVWQRSVSQLSGLLLALANLPAEVITNGKDGLHTIVSVKNTTDQALTLESLKAEMGCRAEVVAPELPLVIAPLETRSLPLHILADATALCPTTESSCELLLQLYPVVHANDRSSRLAIVRILPIVANAKRQTDSLRFRVLIDKREQTVVVPLSLIVPSLG